MISQRKCGSDGNHSSIRGEAEVALARGRTIDEYRDALESSLEEAVRLSDLIGNLLFLARQKVP